VTDVAELKRRAGRKLRTLNRYRRDPRYLRVMGRFIGEGLLFSNESIPPHREAVSVDDVLWAGRAEPRLLELLPALIARRPSLFEDVSQLPEDLARVVRGLRRNRVPETFRGLSGQRIYRWLEPLGRQKRAPAVLKSFRLTPQDVRLLKQLADELGATETEVLRRGLRALL
jgi:hypothetical protein